MQVYSEVMGFASKKVCIGLQPYGPILGSWLRSSSIGADFHKAVSASHKKCQWLLNPNCLPGPNSAVQVHMNLRQIFS